MWTWPDLWNHAWVWKATCPAPRYPLCLHDDGLQQVVQVQFISPHVSCTTVSSFRIHPRPGILTRLQHLIRPSTITNPHHHRITTMPLRRHLHKVATTYSMVTLSVWSATPLGSLWGSREVWWTGWVAEAAPSVSSGAEGMHWGSEWCVSVHFLQLASLSMCVVRVWLCYRTSRSLSTTWPSGMATSAL